MRETLPDAHVKSAVVTDAILHLLGLHTDTQWFQMQIWGDKIK